MNDNFRFLPLFIRIFLDFFFFTTAKRSADFPDSTDSAQADVFYLTQADLPDLTFSDQPDLTSHLTQRSQEDFTQLIKGIDCQCLT